MNSKNELLEPVGTWKEDLDSPLPDFLKTIAHHSLPPELAAMKIRIEIQRWPAGCERTLSASLEESVLDVMRRGAAEIGEPLLPPHATPPLDLLRYRRPGGHNWSEPIADLNIPLWLYIAQGSSRHLGIEYRLAVRINAKWGVAAAESMTPFELLTQFGFAPNEYSLYHGSDSQPLPPNVAISLSRGECFEAQKDGRYGAQMLQGDRTIADDLALVVASGISARLVQEGGQQFVEVTGLEIPSPPWSAGEATIAIAVPGAYPQGGLDGFYLERGVNNAGSIPYQQAARSIDGRTFVLISWHYATGREWNPGRDDLASHIAHCRGYFLKRGVK